MEKEMKKLLLVTVSVGVFLLVTITVAIIIISPRAQNQDNAFYSSAPFSNGRVQPAVDIMSNVPQEPDSIVEIPETCSLFGVEDPDSLIIQIPAPSTAAVPDNRETVVVAPVRPAASAPAARPAAQTPAAAASRAVNDYWIQIGAYSAMVRAEDVKERLATSGLISIIETRIVNGQNFYRVRLGPYTSEREANHWLAIVRNIDGFHESQVRQTIRQQ